MRIAYTLAFAMALAVGGVARGQAPAPNQPENAAPQTQPVQRISTFIGKDTVAVVSLDVPRVDSKAMEDWLAGFVDAAEPDPQIRQAQLAKLHAQSQAVQNWLAKMRQAGVGQVYAIVDRQTLPAPAAPAPDAPEPAGAQEALVATIVVPMQPGQNPQAVEDLLLPKDQGQQPPPEQRLTTAVIRDAVVLASKDRLQQLQQPAQDGVQTVQKALGAVPEAAIQLAVLPSQQMRQIAAAMAEQNGQQLPQGVAPQDIKSLAQDMQWMAIGLDTPPRQALRVVVQASDPQAAQSMAGTVGKLLNAAKQNPAFAARVPNSEQVVAMLTPTAVGDRLTLTLNSQQMDQLFKRDLATAIRSARSEQPIRAGEIPQTQPQR